MEDALINGIAIEQVLARMAPRDRELAVILFAYERPDDWQEAWPPQSYTVIGRYLGLKYEGRAISEATIRFRRQKLLEKWAEMRRNGDL